MGISGLFVLKSLRLNHILVKGQPLNVTATSTGGGRHRELTGATWWFFFMATMTGVSVIIIHLFQLDLRLTGHVLMQETVMGLAISLFAPNTFLLFPATKGASKNSVPLYDYIFAGLVCIAPMWLAVNAYEASIMGWAISPPLMAQICGAITGLLLLEASRRVIGLAFTTLVLFFAVYPLFAQHMPGFLIGKHYSLVRTIGYHSLGIESILGIPLRVLVRLVAGFMVFAVAIQIGGGGKFFLDMALAILGRVRGGPAKVAIFASAFFGSLSGTVVANIATTGAITIPTMKRIGYPAHYAGAIEACASTGGVLMPPIMGVTAFIMAELLGIPYISVAIAAVVPSLLYFFGLFLQVDFYAARTGLKGIPLEEALPGFWQTLKQGWLFFPSIATLLFFLVYLWIDAWAPWFATIVLFGCAMLKKETRLTRQSLIKFVVDTGKVLAELTPVMAAVGMIIGSLSLTGIGFSISRIILSVAGGNVLFSLVLGALVAMILGVGLTMSACYIILAILLAPGLVNAGFFPLAIHLFIMYWGMVSFITPPVAIGAYAAASMAGAPGFKTGFHAMRLGVVIYFVPFFFVLNPALVLHGTVPQIFLALLQAAAGITLIASSMEGYLLRIGKITGIVRLFLFASGILLAFPEHTSSLAGLGIVVALFVVLSIKKFWSKEVMIKEETGSSQDTP